MFMKLDYGGLSRRAAMTRCAFAKAFCADRSRFMRWAVAGFMPEDLPNNSRDAASVIDAVRAVVRTRPAGRPRAAARSAGGRFSKFVVGGGGGARGPCTAARNASSWSLSAAASSAASSASLRRRRFFSFFLRLRSRFRFLSFFFSFLRFRLRLRSSLLELLELELELELLLLLEDAIRGAKPVTAAATTSAPGCSACSAAAHSCLGVARRSARGLVRSMRCQRTAARELWLQWAGAGAGRNLG